MSPNENQTQNDNQNAETENPGVVDSRQPRKRVKTQNKPEPTQNELFASRFMSMWRETLDYTGIPIDVLLVILYRFASDLELPADGKMVKYGSNSNFVPSDETLETWLTEYLKKSEEAELVNDHNLGE